MLKFLTRLCCAGAVVMFAAGCDRIGLGPRSAASVPLESAPAPVVDPGLHNHVGETYAAFVAQGGSAYGPDELGLAANDRTRLWRAMAAPAEGALLTGGGVEALVFRGCAETGCAEGAAVVAIDTATGSVFAGVRDAGGADVMAPNERLEALLRLTSRTRMWMDTPSPEEATEVTAQP